MAKKTQKKKKPVEKPVEKPAEAPRPKDFLDMVAPTAVKFFTDYAIIGGAYHTFMAVRGYPASTDEPALLRHLGEKSGVNVQVYVRQVTAAEEKQIIQNATNRNRMGRSNSNDLQQAVAAESDLQDVAALVTQIHRNREPLEHCAVYIDITAPDQDGMRSLKDYVCAELIRAKISVDPLLLRQREGFLAANLAGSDAFGGQFERVLPASSVANLYIFNYSGKTDPQGFYIGKDKFGSNVITDLDRRAEDKTTASVLILGNSGQGKSFLLKLLLCNILESGKSVICLDPEHELIDLSAKLGGCFVDLMDGRYRINPLEPKVWNVDKREFSAVNIMDGWKTFAMGDVCAAADRAFREEGVGREEQWSRLLDDLEKKEITSAGHLTMGNVSFAEEISEINGLLNFYMDVGFNVDAVFGTHVCTDENDDWLNAYANYDMAAGEVCDELEVDLHRADGSEEAVPYMLNAAEKEVLLLKMDEYCQRQTGQTLEEYSAQLLTEAQEVEPPDGPVM